MENVPQAKRKRWHRARQKPTVLVQEIPTLGPFNSNDLIWEDDIAHMRANRLTDFVEGEGKRSEEEPTNFIKRSSSRRKTTNGTWTTYTQYYCEYGTVSRSKKDPGRCIQDPSNKPKTGKGSRDTFDPDLNYHKDCQCRFTATEFTPSERIPPDTIQLKYTNRSHVNEKGKPCHGMTDPRSRGLRAQMAHSLSSTTR